METWTRVSHPGVAQGISNVSRIRVNTGGPKIYNRQIKGLEQVSLYTFLTVYGGVSIELLRSTEFSSTS